MGDSQKEQHIKAKNVKMVLDTENTNCSTGKCERGSGAPTHGLNCTAQSEACYHLRVGIYWTSFKHFEQLSFLHCQFSK